MTCSALGLISIHALRKESDTRLVLKLNRDEEFQSTLSVRRATHKEPADALVLEISIHALRKESDGLEKHQ